MEFDILIRKHIFLEFLRKAGLEGFLSRISVLAGEMQAWYLATQKGPYQKDQK
jgi:hypothetical protein